MMMAITTPPISTTGANRTVQKLSLRLRERPMMRMDPPPGVVLRPTSLPAMRWEAKSVLFQSITRPRRIA